MTGMSLYCPSVSLTFLKFVEKYGFLYPPCYSQRERSSASYMLSSLLWEGLMTQSVMLATDMLGHRDVHGLSATHPRRRQWICICTMPLPKDVGMPSPTCLCVESYYYTYIYWQHLHIMTNRAHDAVVKSRPGRGRLTVRCTDHVQWSIGLTLKRLSNICKCSCVLQNWRV